MIGGLIFLLVYSAQAIQETSENEGIFGRISTFPDSIRVLFN